MTIRKHLKVSGNWKTTKCGQKEFNVSNVSNSHKASTVSHSMSNASHTGAQIHTCRELGHQYLVGTARH